ncbi:MAG TPA: hypothetical protein VGE38_13640 [Nocardioides sp.]|uniref:hypothetical protein n=1 Tax=Nocardioides sp. TaxID=35761 RepID=UPI002ED839F9
MDRTAASYPGATAAPRGYLRYLGYALAGAAGVVVWLLLAAQPAQAAEEPRPLHELTSRLVQDTARPAVTAATSAVRRTAAVPAARPLREPVETLATRLEQTTERATDDLVVAVARTETALATAVRPERLRPLTDIADQDTAATSAAPTVGAVDRASRSASDASIMPPVAAASRPAVEPIAAWAAHVAGPSAAPSATAEATPQPDPPAGPYGEPGETVLAASGAPGAAGTAVLTSSFATPADRPTAGVLAQHRLRAGTTGPLPGHTPD